MTADIVKYKFHHEGSTGGSLWSPTYIPPPPSTPSSISSPKFCEHFVLFFISGCVGPLDEAWLPNVFALLHFLLLCKHLCSFYFFVSTFAHFSSLWALLIISLRCEHLCTFTSSWAPLASTPTGFLKTQIISHNVID